MIKGTNIFTPEALVATSAALLCAYGHPLWTARTWPRHLKDRALRVSLMHEEVHEAVDAILAGDMFGAIDGLTDTLVIAGGTYVTYYGDKPCDIPPYLYDLWPEGASADNTIPLFRALGRPQVTPMPRHSAGLLLTCLEDLFRAEARNDIGHIDFELARLIRTVDAIGELMRVPLWPYYLEVQRSNWSKLVDGRPLRDEHGKVQKGPSYSAPRIAEMVAHQADHFNDHGCYDDLLIWHTT